MPKHLITSATASELGKKGNAIRWAPKPPQPIAEAIPASFPDYTAKRLFRVRKQLDRLDEMMAEEDDPQRIDKLASAQARLAEQERLLAGRPLPGSHRPRQAGQTLPVAGAWLDDVPAQVVHVAQPEPGPAPSEPTVQPAALSQSVSQSEPEVHNPEQKQV